MYRDELTIYREAKATYSKPKLRSGPIEYRRDYTITLGPGQVRYLDCFSFFGTDIEVHITEINVLSRTPRITSDVNVYAPGRLRGVFESRLLQPLLSDLAWPNYLRVHHALGCLFMERGFPTSAYVLFHERLQLRNHFAIAECAEAWVQEAEFDRPILDSFRGSPEHLIVEGNYGGIVSVFRRTPFVNGKLRLIAERDAAKEAQEREANERARVAEMIARETELNQRLQKSLFTTFVYLMEDTRNGMFKIGRSRTPSKRERTLQSEVPSIVLRFAIPGAEAHETELHGMFSNLRIRGEWFTLSPREIVQIIEFLRSNGDIDRVHADFAWLGMMFLKGGA